MEKTSKNGSRKYLDDEANDSEDNGDSGDEGVDANEYDEEDAIVRSISKVIVLIQKFIIVRFNL